MVLGMRSSEVGCCTDFRLILDLKRVLIKVDFPKPLCPGDRMGHQRGSAGLRSGGSWAETQQCLGITPQHPPAPLSGGLWLRDSQAAVKLPQRTGGPHASDHRGSNHPVSSRAPSKRGLDTGQGVCVCVEGGGLAPLVAPLLAGSKEKLCPEPPTPGPQREVCEPATV